jgi:UPF0755 protein
MDIKPIRRPVQPQVPGQPMPQRPISQRPIQQRPSLPPQPQRPTAPVQQPPLPPIAEAPTPLPIEKVEVAVKKVRKRKKWLIIIASILALGIIIASALWVYYQVQLSPADAKNTSKVKIDIAPATTPKDIATLLKDKGVIRDEQAFLWFTRLDSSQNNLQAGSYRLSPSETTPQIVEHLVKGSVDTFAITFYPGATLVDTKTKLENRIDVTSVLLKAGYSQVEITAALNKTYDHELLKGKPAGTDLEGYIFGETYQFNSGVTVEDILTRTFDEFYKYVVQDNLVEAFKEQGLTLYQGITLASIIQRESGGDDKAQIAQVFFTRLSDDMPLGSDVTYQYIADKEGGVRDPNYNSPYNTRRFAGLPPGPIAVPGLTALRAVAKPAEGNYVYFLSGDDDVTYFARTLDEHEANIANHCKTKCQIL